MKKVKWLLAGAGDIANRRVAPALVEAANSELIAICDIKKENAVRLAGRLGVKTVFADYAQALAESGADAVYIATPQDKHVEMSLEALEAGKHFLCEKPLGLNGAECLRLLAAVRKSDRITSCSNYRRLSEQYKLTDAMLKRQEIGKLVGGWAVYSTPFYNPGNHPIKKALGMSRIKELGFYQIDIAQNLFGMPSSVMAQASIINKAVMNDVEDIATVVLKFPGGEIFTIIFNCSSPGTRHELEFFGSEGRIYWPEWPPHGNGPVYKITRSGTEKLEAHTIFLPHGKAGMPALRQSGIAGLWGKKSAENWHLPMIEDYVNAVLKGRQPVCTIESAVKTEIITDAIFRSIESGKLELVDWKG